MLKIENLEIGSTVLILGFGKEGQSTFHFLVNNYPEIAVWVSDSNKDLKPLMEEFGIKNYLLGEDYLSGIERFDAIIKSPGIPISILSNKELTGKITSQAEIFLQLYRDQIIGITGTKGKSTTSSLIYHILSIHSRNVFLVGNIGIPPLDQVAHLNRESIIVYEMSSHQLDGINVSPRIALLLNIFEEHLDHYGNMELYREAKYRIFQKQVPGDWLILNKNDDDLINDLQKMELQGQLIGYSLNKNSNCEAVLDPDGIVRYSWENEDSFIAINRRKSLPGKHNELNIMAAICACKILHIEDQTIEKGITSFGGLEHRLEYVGKFGGINFYNDSIATIPEATIEAVKTLGYVDTLILGGKNRGINYQKLINFLTPENVSNLILVGEVGLMLKKHLQNHSFKIILISSFEGLGQAVKSCTNDNGICLLSPAASSYDMFKNFEHRGDLFKKIARSF